MVNYKNQLKHFWYIVALVNHPHAQLVAFPWYFVDELIVTPGIFHTGFNSSIFIFFNLSNCDILDGTVVTTSISPVEGLALGVCTAEIQTLLVGPILKFPTIILIMYLHAFRTFSPTAYHFIVTPARFSTCFMSDKLIF